MAKLERPKGYSRKLWKQLTNKIRSIKRFISEKTKTGARIIESPDVTDVYTKEGRKSIRQWTAKKQWEKTEYVDTETGEYFTGKEAKGAWSKHKKESTDTYESVYETPSPEPEDVQSSLDIYNRILDEINKIDDGRWVGRRGKRSWQLLNTGGFRTMLTDMLNDLYSSLDDADTYLQQNEAELLDGLRIIQYDSDVDEVRTAFDKALTILNEGKTLSKEQLERATDTAYNF